jgi:hypothetical protein
VSSWYVAPSLNKLRDQINAAHPGRDRSSDGAIGDASHSARKSDHNPDWSAGGVVRARDFDVDGIDEDAILAGLITDDRVEYLIFDEEIWTRGTRQWRPYSGVNPHEGHFHISIRHGRAFENDTRPWLITRPAPPALPTTTEEDDMLYLVGDKAPEVYSFDAASGKRRYVPHAEYMAVTAAGVKVHTIPQARLDKLPKVAGSR